jgi:hypothetical protein
MVGFAHMKRHLWSIVLTLVLLAHTAEAAIPAVYTNDNIWQSEHDRPITIEQDNFGNFTGTTATGKVFYQNNIENSLSIRLQRFAIDEAFFYVSDKGIIIAPNDTVALSIYLTRLG